jgi:GNAT superfamily N-acetyltransferase
VLTGLNVREATEDDLIPLMIMAKAFHKESPYKDMLPWDNKKVEQTIRSGIANENTCVFVLEDGGELVGMLGAVYTEAFFSAAKVAAELSWWVDPEYRGRKESVGLVKAYENWAKSKGVKAVNMMDLTLLNELGPLYEKLGYTKYETTYVKVL